MHRLTIALIGLGLVWGLVGTAAAQSTASVQVTPNPQLGSILTDGSGMTLYRFTRDESGVSNCYDQCATNWPAALVVSGDPVPPAGLSGTLTIVTRRDGGRQLAYNGMPLYRSSRDSAPGDTNGQGLNNVWFVVEAAGS